MATRAVLIVFVAISLGVSATLIVRHNAGPAPLAFAAIRLGVAVVVLLPIGLVSLRKPNVRADVASLFRNWWFYVGVSSWSANIVIGYAGMAKTSSINTGVIGATSPVWTIAIAAVFYKKHVGSVRPRQILLATIASCAAAVAVLVSTEASGANRHGDFLVFSALLLGVFWLLSGAVLIKQFPSILIIGCALSIAFVVVLPIAIASGQFGDVTKGIWIGAAWCAFAGTSQNIMQTWAMKHMIPALVGVIALLQPLELAFFGWLLFEEHFAAAQGIAGIVVIASIALLVRDRASTKDVAQPHELETELAST